jgi:hypothetical protein
MCYDLLSIDTDTDVKHDTENNIRK